MTLMPEITHVADGEFEAVVSLLAGDDWQTPLPESVPVFVNCEMTPAKTVAVGKPFFDPHGWLRIRARFVDTPFAHEIRALVESGAIDTVQDQSVVNEASDFRHVLIAATILTNAPAPTAPLQ